MGSPSKILLFALCVTAVVAYFGEKLTLLTNHMQTQKRAAPAAGNELVYADTTMADYDREITVPMARDGHYWLTLEVNGMPVRFVVDTGASHISLSYNDAAAVGLDPAGLDYNRRFRTANGESRKALVTLDRVALESIQLTGVTASVSQPGQIDVSLLGMSFLSKLSSFKMEGGELILKP